MLLFHNLYFVSLKQKSDTNANREKKNQYKKQLSNSFVPLKRYEFLKALQNLLFCHKRKEREEN